MKLSSYVTKYNLNKHIAFYHSLKMIPVFLNLDEVSILNDYLKNKQITNLNKDLINLLRENFILIDESKDEEDIIKLVQSYVDAPYISLAYFVLTEQCNLACRYCFLGNDNPFSSKVTNFLMTIETAEKALEFFSFQTQQDISLFNDEKEIIFYGGEPLLNFETLKYIVNRSKYYQSNNKLSQNLKFSIITNGILLNEENINFFLKHNINVSISIDGPTFEDNHNRIFKNNKPIYYKLLEKLNLAKKMGLNFSLSITLTENIFKNLDNLFDFLENFNIDSICFNILLKNNNYKIDTTYYHNATEFIINFYKKAKFKGIYEERFMRKLQAFSKAKIYFSDCAATSGSQIVITPDGGVGLCQGCTETREYFLGNIYDKNLNIKNTPQILAWNKAIPIFKEACRNCPALGICGGGCPINAKKINNVESINSIDYSFCIHAKKILSFLIEELYSIVSKNNF